MFNMYFNFRMNAEEKLCVLKGIVIYYGRIIRLTKSYNK